jgi:hypothetical protein
VYSIASSNINTLIMQVLGHVFVHGMVISLGIRVIIIGNIRGWNEITSPIPLNDDNKYMLSPE